MPGPATFDPDYERDPEQVESKPGGDADGE
jgi:hypothetical protein